MEQIQQSLNKTAFTPDEHSSIDYINHESLEDSIVYFLMLESEMRNKIFSYIARQRQDAIAVQLNFFIAEKRIPEWVEKRFKYEPSKLTMITIAFKKVTQNRIF